jgi:plastocyanin
VVHMKRLLLVPALWIACVAMAAGVSVQVTDGNGKPLADAVVFLESPAAKAAARPATGAEIAQSGKQFAPSVTVVPVGSSVHFPNRDTVRHHVYSFSPAKTFELKLYTGTPANPVLFDKAGVVVLGCNIHDHMIAWVLVVETPYYGKTNAEGTVTLNHVPAGNYRLRSWHSAMAPGTTAQSLALTVAATDATVGVVLKGVSP